MRQIRHPPLRLPRVAPVLFLFYHVRSPSDETTPLGHVCGPCPSSTTQGSFPHRTGIIRPSSLRIHIHVGQQGHLRLTYSNKSWSIVAQGMFQLREINQMEREMCQYLEWELNVDPATLKEFEMGRCVGALAPLPLVLLGSGGFFCSTPVCGCTCTPPARLVGFWGIGFLDAGVWAHLRSSLRCPLLGHMPSTALNYIP